MSPRHVLAALLAVCIMTIGWSDTAPLPAETQGSPSRTSLFPAGPRPDLVVLSWAGDPRNSVSVQWRSNGPGGQVLYLPEDAVNPFLAPRPPLVARAETTRIADPGLTNYAFTYWHTAQLTKLRPGTRYTYVVGDPQSGCWSTPRTFRTAPAKPEPFSFLYLGDAQYGFTRWGALLRAAYRNRPDSAFALMAGDLVTRGNDRDDWDDFLVHGSEVLSQLPVLPTIGNHECKGGSPRMYLQTFDLPKAGPPGLEPERCYSLNYGNALFVVLDSTSPPDSQTAWLERQLSNSSARWKLVMFHHPPYSSREDRDNKELREAWVPVFDKHHVDIVFCGHDHAYMRTYPMRGGQRVASPAEGTIYMVSVAGTKMYEQADRDYMEARFTETICYSTVDILPETEKAGERLILRTYDLEGELRDRLVIDK